MATYRVVSAEDFEHEGIGPARTESLLIRDMTSGFNALFDRKAEPNSLYVLADDNRSGVVIRSGGEITHLFSLEKGRGDELVNLATLLGGRYLDCFDGYLPKLYARHGFVETNRESNWTPGEPDVVYMTRA